VRRLLGAGVSMYRVLVYVSGAGIVGLRFIKVYNVFKYCIL
jgi:hypothetical protein